MRYTVLTVGRSDEGIWSPFRMSKTQAVKLAFNMNVLTHSKDHIPIELTEKDLPNFIPLEPKWKLFDIQLQLGMKELEEWPEEMFDRSGKRRTNVNTKKSKHETRK